MASQNMDPAATAASSTAALKGSESGGSAARGSVSKRWVSQPTGVVFLASWYCTDRTISGFQVLAGIQSEKYFISVSV